MATLAHNLDVRRAACKSCWPGITVGWIGDAAHQQEQSDHNTDSRGDVHAIDVMVVGAAAQAVVNWCLANPADLEYIIHNRVIWTRSNNWKPKKYTGSDPHTNHVHISGKHGTVGKDSATGTGYDAWAQGLSPSGTPCHPTVPAKPPLRQPPVTHKAGSRVCVQGMSGPDVLFAQRFIGEKEIGGGSHYDDGVMGPNTVKGVKWYQNMRGGHARVTGKLDAWTWGQMQVRFTG